MPRKASESSNTWISRSKQQTTQRKSARGVLLGGRGQDIQGKGRGEECRQSRGRKGVKKKKKTQRRIQLEHKMGWLTWRSLDTLRRSELVGSAVCTDSFVARTDCDNRDEGEDEIKRGANVPLAENDAKVLGVPSEEHLQESERQKVSPPASIDRSLAGGCPGIEGEWYAHVHAAHSAAVVAVTAIAVVHVAVAHMLHVVMVRVVHLVEELPVGGCRKMRVSSGESETKQIAIEPQPLARSMERDVEGVGTWRTRETGLEIGEKNEGQWQVREENNSRSRKERGLKARSARRFNK